MGQLIGDLHFSLPFDCGGNGRCGKCIVGLAPLPNNLHNPTSSSSQRQVVFTSLDEWPEGSFEKVRACCTSIDQDLLIGLPDPENVYSSIHWEMKKGKIDPNSEFGIAIDLGSTTLVLALVDLNARKTVRICSSLNPQIVRGSDMISRIGYAVRGDRERKELQDLILNQIIKMIHDLEQNTGLPEKKVTRMSIAGNTVMEYLFLGLDPDPLGRFPFEPPIRQFSSIRASDLRLPIHTNARIFLFPIFAGLIGGDIVSGIYDLQNRGLSAALKKGSSNTDLFLDLGTNGEIVLIQNGRCVVAATAAGPAFEGAGIQCGMPGINGAIERVDFKSGITFRTIGGGEPRGICGSGLVDLIALMLNHGIIDPGGRFCKKTDARFSMIDPDLRDRIHLLGTHPVFQLNDHNGRSVCLTQKDIRQIQLAVGAVRAGIRLLAEEKNFSLKDFNKIFIAGGFGNHLRIKNAFRIGLFPGEMGKNRCKFLGNTSLNGAISSLYDSRSSKEIKKLIQNVEHLDLASLPNFQDIFVESMIFPPT